MQNIKVIMIIPRIYIFHIFQIMLVYGTIYAISTQTSLVKGQEIIPACMMGNMVGCKSELEIRLHNDSIAYRQLKKIKSAYNVPFKAATRGFNELIEVLLNSGVHIDQYFSQNNTMLHYATQYANFDTVNFLLTHGANVSVRESAGETPLHKCASNGDVRITVLLLHYGADINAKTRSGNTPLHHAVYGAHSEVIQCLLKRGCDRSIANNYGYTAEEEAEIFKMVEIQKLFSSR